MVLSVKCVRVRAPACVFTKLAPLIRPRILACNAARYYLTINYCLGSAPRIHLIF